VPPMTAMWMGSVRREKSSRQKSGPHLLKMCFVVWSGRGLV
jgi:hypothetical protein